ncbi:MAG: peptidase S16 [Chitinophagaceae bacterium]|nr:MAG: peptidase S16 [Chitinophagaceae bacterium]
MTNFIPIFPLGIVVYPGEKLNLHIFEPRYKQLIGECIESKKPFGIPAVINGEVKEMGTLVMITEVSKVYEDGKMDIKSEGLEVFKILEVIKELPEKLYSGAIVTYPPNLHSGNLAMMKLILSAVRQIYKKLHVSKDFLKDDKEINSYDVAHLVGLSLEEEYLILELQSELHRQEYLKRHLAKVLPIMNEMESLKKKIRQNGHFKNLGGFNFK